MKLILIPSDPSFGPRVSIAIPGDGFTIDTVIDQLITPALIAFGFAPATVRDGYENADVPGEPVPEVHELVAPRPYDDGGNGPPPPPDGFTVLGFNLRIDYARLPSGRDDLRYTYRGPDWYGTPYVNGCDVWYAVRTGSETHHKIQAILTPAHV